MQNCDIYIKLFACCTCSDYASTIPLDLCLSFVFFSNQPEKIILVLKRCIQFMMKMSLIFNKTPSTQIIINSLQINIYLISLWSCYPQILTSINS